MIIECNYCKAMVDAELVASHEDPPDETDTPFDVSLLICPSCKNTLVGGQYIWSDPDSGEVSKEILTRLWPQPKKSLSWSIPSGIRESIDEAHKCFRAGAHIACAAMAGRALEGVCRHFKTKSKFLGGGLKELREKEVIDSRLFEWSQELQKHRNLAAHASDEKISRGDAEDLLDFVIAICEYVFVLTERFQNFMSRKPKNAHSS
jgi:hypothetical protein